MASDEKNENFRKPWDPVEDQQLRDLVAKHGTQQWALIATEMRTRNGKQCRERWRNHLRPELNKGDWSAQEDIDIWNHVQEMGTKWAQISEQYMPSRTDNDIKNRWNSIIRKSHAPGGREWDAAENETRALFLGSASRTQSRKNAGNDRRRPRAGGDKKVTKLAKPSPESPESPESPPPHRKLFDSPLGVSADGHMPQTPGPSQAEVLEAVHGGLVTAQDVTDVLMQGEISAETFNVEAFLPDGIAAGSISALSSPVRRGSRPALPPPARTSACAAPSWIRTRADWERAAPCR